MICAQSVVLSSLLFQLAGGSCPPGCLCASDILTCVSQGLEQLPSQMPVTTAVLDLSHNRLTQLEDGGLAGLLRLNALRLAHNRLARLLNGAFRGVGRGLRHLDLSSNELHVIEHHYFQDLGVLEELLLFNNRIVRIESRALIGLSHLRKVYLSHNRLTDFPFFSIKGHSHPFLRTLDLSSNRLPRLPLEDITVLPVSVQSGLFLHNNTLICDCDLYTVLRRWEKQGFGSVRDYREQHTCLVYGEHRVSVHFLHNSRFFENCTLPGSSLTWEPGANLLASAGDPVLLDCLTSIDGKSLSYLWVSPSQEYIAPPGNNQTLRLFPNGSLLIQAAQTEDSGIYMCMAVDRMQLYNRTWEVNVTVVSRRSPADSFNTGFTTLLGCVVSLVLVLMYLYLTPCRCWCRTRPPLPPAPSPISEQITQPNLHKSPPSGTEGPGRKPGTNKHVVFLEPLREVQNGRLRASLMPEPKSISSFFVGRTVTP
ncbi:amphoterin-induced protein 3-like [Scleropages formosus]|uniref:Amphoterin-induced protein 3-like n=1 Tax=Scleropages formosus TaxID=113540 RepID=A0A0P7U792_SCLFO|nr:amphoterin-induced protein 3-like [Scleropages formosus]KPP63415.1 amphoterin-induced protein 3-like [Scleropages formosus]